MPYVSLSGVHVVVWPTEPPEEVSYFYIDEIPEPKGKENLLLCDFENKTVFWIQEEPKRYDKLSDLSAAGNAAIVEGVDVTLPSTGETEHFSLMETDQINLTAALTAVEMGAAGYPYHADGQLCRLYPAQDILAISQAAIAHKLYHTTYCNHLLVWARRAERAEELAGITYGDELPEDLADNLAAVLSAAGGVADA